jgi:hypothetical protein
VPLSDIVNVSISLETGQVTQAGFGLPLILGAHSRFTDRIRFYTDLAGMVADGFVSTDAEYKAAAAMFAQTPRPQRIAIGRRAAKPTQQFTITPLTPTPTIAMAYKVRVGDRTATYNAAASPTVASITAGLAAQITALAPAWTASTAYAVGDRRTNAQNVYECTVAGTSAAATGPTGTGADIVDNVAHWRYVFPAVTATDGGTYCRVTLQTAGAWQSVEVLDTSLLSIEQDQAAVSPGTELDAIKAVNSDWYAVVSVFSSRLEIPLIAQWVEANEKLFVVATQDTPVVNVSTTTGSSNTADDVARQLKGASYARTALVYHPNNGAFADAAWAARLLPEDPGSETWKFKTLAGVAAVSLTPTQQANAAAKYCNYYYALAGRSITAEGVVASNEFIDVIRGRDWVKARLQERIFARLANAKKIPYTDAGVAVVEAEVRAQLREAVDEGFLSASPEPTVSVPAVASVSSTDRAARYLPDVRFTGVLAGAIHKLTLKGVVTV